MKEVIKFEESELQVFKINFFTMNKGSAANSSNVCSNLNQLSASERFQGFHFF